MAAPGLDQVMAFLTDHGFAGAASALRDDVLARTAAGDEGHDAALGPRLPPLRMPAAGTGSGSGAGSGTPAPASPGSSSGSASSSAFVSMRSTPSGELLNLSGSATFVSVSALGLVPNFLHILPILNENSLSVLPTVGLLNPYGLWSPRHSQSDVSSSEMEFGTARQYDTTDLFFQEDWLYDDHLFPSKLDDEDDEREEEDKFVLDAHGGASAQTEIGKLGAGHNHRHEHIGGDRCEGCAEVYTCSSPLCGCCGGGLKNDGLHVARSSSSTVYGRYQIMDDRTETMDDCAQDGFQLKQSGDIMFECGMQRDPGRGDDDSDLSVVEKELQMLSSFDTDAVTNHGVHDFTDNGDLNGICDKNPKISIDKEYLKGHRIQPFPEIGDPDEAYEFRNVGSLNADVQHSTALEAEEDAETNIDLALSDFHREYEVFELRIIHRKNRFTSLFYFEFSLQNCMLVDPFSYLYNIGMHCRTGFEENKDFPIVLNSVVAGRYCITEYLGSAAFSKVVQAHDLQTGMDVCLKIIKNDKDFFDQSLDEIKLLKFVNKYDPLDEHHVLRLYDYFYHQKYNQESGGEVYFTLPRIQVIARQCLEALVYLHHLRIIHCDLKPENILIKSYSRCEIKVIDLGSSCFLTDNLCLYVQSRSYRAPEVILGLPYDQRIDIWSLGCIISELYTGEVLFPNEPVSMMLAQMIGIIGPVDMEMLELGQETQKYFTDDYDLFTKNEETDQLEYLIPEKTSLRRHLQCPDSEFVDFLSYLLQINPRKRPTADEALQHPWLSFAY
ncbi:Protein kinase superfamily protein [Zea mays]|uniref:Protein kinase superfamily protein n=1 Tax=Zea mays TaxID=4577 RepID=A0A1D6G8W8_MAIZE|nr:Protein kinase superfamily protein [Zea mays]